MRPEGAGQVGARPPGVACRPVAPRGGHTCAGAPAGGQAQAARRSGDPGSRDQPGRWTQVAGGEAWGPGPHARLPRQGDPPPGRRGSPRKAESRRGCVARGPQGLV